jgi:hypothetical protein
MSPSQDREGDQPFSAGEVGDSGGRKFQSSSVALWSRGGSMSRERGAWPGHWRVMPEAPYLQESASMQDSVSASASWGGGRGPGERRQRETAHWSHSPGRRPGKVPAAHSNKVRGFTPPSATGSLSWVVWQRTTMYSSPLKEAGGGMGGPGPSPSGSRQRWQRTLLSYRLGPGAQGSER